MHSPYLRVTSEVCEKWPWAWQHLRSPHFVWNQSRSSSREDSMSISTTYLDSEKLRRHWSSSITQNSRDIVQTPDSFHYYPGVRASMFQECKVWSLSKERLCNFGQLFWQVWWLAQNFCRINSWHQTQRQRLLLLPSLYGGSQLLIPSGTYICTSETGCGGLLILLLRAWLWKTESYSITVQ